MDFEYNTQIIAKDMRHAFAARNQGHLIVLPLDGLGTGLSELPQCAPKTNAFLLEMLDMLECGGNPAWKSILND